MFQFHWPILFLALPLPWLHRGLLPRAHTQNTGCLYAPFATQLTIVSEHSIHRLGQWRWWLLAVIWLLLIIAAARPQWLGDPVRLQQSGRSLMIAVDASGSMATTDLDPSKKALSRLDVVKQLAGDFITRRHGDRIGLILFGSNAYLQAPLTFDRSTVTTLLTQAMVGIAGRETAIGNALGLAIKQLREAPKGKGVLVLMTDGANTAGIVSPRRAAEFAASQGLRVYTIGVGAKALAVSSLPSAPVVNPAADLDEALLQYIADKTGGRYFRATDKQELQAIYRLLDKLEPVAGGSDTIRPVTALYPWPLGLALLLSFALTAPAVRG